MVYLSLSALRRRRMDKKRSSDSTYLPLPPRVFKPLQYALGHVVRLAHRRRRRILRLLRARVGIRPFRRHGHTPRLALADLAVDRHGARDHAAHVADVARHHDGRALLGEPAKRLDVLLRHAQADGAAGGVLALAQAAGDGVDAAGRGGRADEDGLRLAGGRVDLLALERLGREDDALLAALGDVDGALPLPFALEDLGPLAPLRRDLPVHRLNHRVRGVDVADLVPEADDAPVARRLVDRLGDVGVEGGPFAQDVVEGEAADFAAHRRLRQLADGVLGVFHPVAGFVGVKDPRVQHAVELQGYVVRGDGALLGYFHCRLLERLDVGDAVDYGEEDGDAGLEDPVELAHSLDYPCRLLGHEADYGVGGKGGP